MTPTQKALAFLKAEGWQCQVVERWCAFSRRRVDLFGFIDIIAVKGSTTLGVQATSSSNHAARVKKTTEHANLDAVLTAGWAIEVWSWREMKGHRAHQRKVTTIGCKGEQATPQ